MIQRIFARNAGKIWELEKKKKCASHNLISQLAESGENKFIEKNELFDTYFSLSSQLPSILELIANE